MAANPNPKITDTIPRASIEQIFAGLQLLAVQDRTTFDDVRMHLLGFSKRKAPNTATAMWTVARDVLTELGRLEFATIGMLPRRLSDVGRLADTPCEILPSGVNMAALYSQNAGQAYDALLIRWIREHPYFRGFMLRLAESPLYVPDVTNVGQLGLEAVKGMAVPTITAELVASCSLRLQEVDWSADKLQVLSNGIERRAISLRETMQGTDIDAKRLVDIVQDGMVIPAFLEAEGLTFDPVTFQQLLKCAQQFICAAWTASHPRFSGRVIFQTCEFDVPIDDWGYDHLSRVIHHGLSYAKTRFAKAVQDAYIAVAGASSGYVSAYAVRAIVCVDLQLPPVVFDRSLEALVADGPQADLTMYTELPFEPPPQGEDYVVVGRNRIGKLKLIYKPGE